MADKKASQQALSGSRLKLAGSLLVAENASFELAGLDYLPPKTAAILATFERGPASFTRTTASGAACRCRLV